MIKQHCISCDQVTWHNESGKKDGTPRCTYCGHPITTNSVGWKREHQASVRDKQVRKVRLV